MRSLGSIEAFFYIVMLESELSLHKFELMVTSKSWLITSGRFLINYGDRLTSPYLRRKRFNSFTEGNSGFIEPFW